jgi:hypothetical protein
MIFLIKDLHLIIYNYLSSSHKHILKIKNNKFRGKNLIKYDSDLLCYIFKNNIKFNRFKIAISCAKFGKLKISSGYLKITI